MMTSEMKEKVAEIKKDPRNREAICGKTDEEILAAFRFVEDGKGLDVYDSEEAWKMASMEQAMANEHKRKQEKEKANIDEIEEV